MNATYSADAHCSRVYISKGLWRPRKTYTRLEDVAAQAHHRRRGDRILPEATGINAIAEYMGAPRSFLCAWGGGGGEWQKMFLKNYISGI
jgi:hypothetical protein